MAWAYLAYRSGNFLLDMFTLDTLVWGDFDCHIGSVSGFYILTTALRGGRLVYYVTPCSPNFVNAKIFSLDYMVNYHYNPRLFIDSLMSMSPEIRKKSTQRFVRKIARKPSRRFRESRRQADAARQRMQKEHRR